MSTMTRTRAHQAPAETSASGIKTLDDAKSAVAGARALDPLYQQALAFSTHSYCAH